MRTIKFVAVSVVLGFAATTFQPVVAENASNVFDGEWRFQTSCGSCHGKNGQGIYAFGPALKGNSFGMQAPAVLIMNVIQNGRSNRNKNYPDYSGMPSF